MERLSLQRLTEAQLDRAAGENLALHMGWVQQRTPGMRVETGEHLTLVDSGLPTDTFNVVCGANLPEASLQDEIARVVEHFRTVRRPFAWWVGPHDCPPHLGEALQAAGLAAEESETAMAVDLNALPLKDLADHTPHNLRIERARTPEQIRAFATVVAANWTPPDPAVLQFYDAAIPALTGIDCPLWLYVGYLGNEPVAACELSEGGGVVGLYSVCTREAYRRRGIGSALVLRSLLDARNRGWQTAVLQASDGGRGVYARLGFQATGRFTEYHPVED